jgi:excisionase family DNA binding protein
MKDRLIRPDQTAQKLNVSTRTIYRLLAEGQLTGCKIRGCLRVRESSVEDYIRRQIALYQLENGTGGAQE